MNLFDMKTVIFSCAVSNAICAVVMALLWIQNRRRFAGPGFWLAGFVMQFAATMLTILRGAAPDIMSIVGGNTLVILGAIFLYAGMGRFVGKRSPQIHNTILLVVFILVHAYFVFMQPSLVARNINFSLGLLVVCLQCVWLMLHKVDGAMCPATRGVGIVCAAFCLVSAARIIMALVAPPGNDFFHSNNFETLLLLTYQMLFIVLTFALFLMVNRRLFADQERDIAMRRQVEEALRMSEEKFFKAFHASPDAILISRVSDGQFIEANEGFSRLSEYSQKEALASSSIALGIWADPQDREKCIATLKHHSVRDCEYNFRTKSGKILNCLYSGEIIYLGNKAHILSVVHDITERKQTEAQVAQLASFPQLNPNPIIEVDMTGTVVFYNPAALATLKRLGRPADTRAFVPPDIDTILRALAQAEQPWFEREVELNHTVWNEYIHLIPKFQTARIYANDITARKRAEAYLQARERELRTITDNIPIYIGYVDAKLHYRFVNQKYVEAFGLDSGEIVGKHIRDVLGEAYYNRAAPMMEAALAGHEVSFESMLNLPRLGPRWLSVNYVPEAAASGPGGGIYILVQDITERKRAEEALREKTEELDRFFSLALDLLCIADTDGYFRRLNQAWEKILGYSLADMEGQKFLDLVHPEDMAATLAAVGELSAGQEVLNFVNRYRCKDGSYRWIEWRSAPYGKLIYAAARDITARKQAEETIRRSEEHFRLLFETNPFPILITRAADGAIIRVNQALLDYMESSRTDLTSVRAPDYYALSTDRQALLDEAKAKGRVVNQAVELKTAQGRSKFALVNITPLDFAGEPCLLVGMADITERKRAEDELRSLNQRFELYLKYIPIPMYVKNADTRAVILSYHFEQMLGKPVSELLGKTNEELWPPELAGPMTLDDQRIMYEGQATSVEESFAGRYYHSVKFPIKEPDQPPMLGGYTIDITELKRREQVQVALYRISEAAQSAQNLNELFAAIHVVIGELMAAKNFYIALYDEFDGLIRFVYHVDEHDPTPSPYRPNKGLTAYVLRTGKPLLASPEVYRQLLESGEVEPTGAPAMDWIGVPLKTVAQKTIGMMAVQTYDPGIRYIKEDKNILLFVSTQVAMAIERKQAEEARHESEARMRQITAALRQAVWLQDARTFQVLYVNPAYEEIWGRTRESLIADPASLIQAVHPEDAERVLEAIQRQYEGVFFNHEHRIVRPDGDMRWVWGRTFPIENDAGQVYRILAVSEDITERKQMEAELIQAKEAAEAANQAKSQFLANMSHELRTPLTAILGFAELMMHDELQTVRQRENVEIIHRSGEHLLALINEVLDLSKIEAGRVEVQPEVFDLHEMLLGLGEMFSLRAEQKGLTVVFDLAPGVPQHIYADKSKLRQVLINLLGNAVKFTERGGIILKAKEGRHVDKEQVVRDESSPVSLSTLYFEIQDSGIGIAPEELDKVFAAFVQTESGRQSGQGTGLGLPISCEYVRLMGGDMTVQSEVGKGSCFRFDIQIEPLSSDEFKTQTMAASRQILKVEPGQQAPDGGPFRLLIAEDNESARDLLVALLRPLGFELREAVNGQDAVEIWDSWHPHLIWMDMRMPVLDGYEATRRIKAIPQGQQTVIVALSASAFDQDHAQILAAGCDDFLRKPFREAEVFDILSRYLGIRFVYAAESTAAEDLTAEGKPPGLVGAVATTMAAIEVLKAYAPQDLPAGWKLALRQAIVVGDVRQILAIVGELGQHRDVPELVDSLTELAHCFELDKILVWLEGRKSG